MPVRVQALGGQRHVDTFALLDSGSTCTFCEEGLLTELGVVGQPETMSLTTLNKTSPLQCRTASLSVQNPENGDAIVLDRVVTKGCFPQLGEHRCTVEDASRWSHLAKVPLPKCPVTYSNVRMLIGVDSSEALIPYKTIVGDPGEPYATETRLGWTVIGPVGKGWGSRL